MAHLLCDGQILVTDDIIGLSGFYPKFVKKYIDLGKIIENVIKQFKRDVKSMKFPKTKTVIKMSENNINQKFNFSDFLKQNKLKIISVSSLSIISIVLFFIFNEMQEKNIEISENFNKAKILIEKIITMKL